MPKVRLTGNLQHNGQTYLRGKVFEGDKALVDQLIADGVAEDPNAKAVVDGSEDDSEAQAAKIVADAESKAAQTTKDAEEASQKLVDEAKAQAKAEAEKVVAAAQEQAAKIVDDAKAEAEKVRADAEKPKAESKPSGK